MSDTALAEALAAVPPVTTSTPKLEADFTPTSVTVKGAVVGQAQHDQIAAGDWTPVLAMFNLDPAHFDVVNDTVRMSTWQQSARSKSGDRDIVQLYSYGATFRRLVGDALISPETAAGWRSAMMTRIPKFRPRPATLDAGTYLILVADPQLGKKGTAEAVENWQRGVLAHMAEAKRLGPRVQAVHVAFMGDEHENVVNSYGNQPHTVELNRSRQLELDYDLRVWTIREALGLGKPTTASSVISNHGEWTRNGGKEPVTSANDNSSTSIARLVQKHFDDIEQYTKRHVEWTIGETHPGVLVTLSGEPAYFSHGYVEKGRGTSTETRTRQAIERQILGRTDDLGTIRIWNMAHYHHFYTNEFEGRTLFGCPALEAERSSEYMLDQFGVWSPPGLLGYLIGRNVSSRGWANVNVY